MKEKIIDQYYDELDKYWSKLNQTIESLKKRPGW